MQTALHSNHPGIATNAYRQPLAESWKTLSDMELVKKCQAGERAALDELIRRYQSLIFHRAYRLTHNRDTAEDIAAATYLGICRGIGTCKYPMALASWINCIVQNVWMDTLRRSQRHPEVSLDILENLSAEQGLYLSPARETLPLQKQVEANESKRILNQAIATLPDFLRQIVTLFYRDERTYEEITEMMGLPIGTVKSRLYRARYALREKLAPQMAALMN